MTPATAGGNAGTGQKSPVAVTTPQIGEKTMAKKLTREMIEKAIAAIKGDETHDTFGIRTQEIPFEPGKIYHHSYVWDAGEMTDEELNGICATNIDPDNIVKSLNRHKGYVGDHIAILAGGYAASGDDPFEVVMETPDVIAILA